MKIAQIAKKIPFIILTILPILLLGFIVEQNFSFSGERIHTYDLSEDNDIISRLRPWQRISPISQKNGEYSQEIKDNIVYFDIEKTDPFETLTLEITFNQTDTEIIEIGARAGEDFYTRKPLYSKQINDLEWHRIKKDNIILFQKKQEFETIEEFFQKFPTNKNTITYFYNLEQNIDKKILENANVSTLGSEANLDEADFLITTYKNPTINENKIQTTATFDYSKLQTKNEKFEFQITTPGLRENNHTLEINQIKAVYKKEPLSFEKIINKLTQFFNI